MTFDGVGDENNHEEEDEEMGFDEDNEGEEVDDDDDDDDDVNDYDYGHHEILELNMVERSDPKLTKLTVGYMNGGGYIIPPGDDWAGLGNAIGRNKYLKELSLYDYDRDTSVKYLLDFLPGLSLNCSIKKLSIGGWNYSDGEVWNHLTQFFKYNKLNCLKVYCNSSLSTNEFETSLRRFDSLTEFTLISNPDNSWVHNIILALTDHTDLRKLRFRYVEFGNIFRNNDNRRPCCDAMVTLLQNPRSNLKSLHLNQTNIDDVGATIIASGLRSSTTLSEIVFSYENKITGAGWESIFFALKSSRCMIVKLGVLSCTFNRAATFWLFAALLQHTSTIKTLILNHARGITDTGWITLFHILRDPNAVLETLNLDFNSFTNEVLVALTSALTNNSRLKELTVREYGNVPVELLGFSNVLRNPNSALEILDLGMHPMDDQTIISFAEALFANSRLKHLRMNLWLGLGLGNTSVTRLGHDALIQLLCNKSSITDTYLSNHILRIICDDYEEDFLPEDLLSLLELNRENNSSQAARLKIIQTHFSGSEINMQPFMDLDLGVKPFVIAWMVRDNNGYPLLRALPLLLDMSSGGKSRLKKRPYE